MLRVVGVGDRVVVLSLELLLNQRFGSGSRRWLQGLPFHREKEKCVCVCVCVYEERRNMTDGELGS